MKAPSSIERTTTLESHLFAVQLCKRPAGIGHFMPRGTRTSFLPFLPLSARNVEISFAPEWRRKSFVEEEILLIWFVMEERKDHRVILCATQITLDVKV